MQIVVQTSSRSTGKPKNKRACAALLDKEIVATIFGTAWLIDVQTAARKKDNDV